MLSQMLTKSFESMPSQKVISKNSAFTYDHIYKKAKALAEKLARCKNFHNLKLVIYGRKSIDTLTALCASILSETTYIPVDAEAPLERALKIINDCEPQFIFCDAVLKEQLIDLPIVSTEKLHNGQCYLLHLNYKQAANLCENTAAVLYTSGSTGQPKGVMLSHRNVLSFLDWCAAAFKLTNKETFISISPLHFDLSLFDILYALKIEASVVLVDQEISRNPRLLTATIAQQAVSVLYSTPTLLTLLMEYGKIEKHDFSSLKQINFAGEVFPIAKLKKLRKLFPRVAMYNLYGPTETNVCTWHKVPSEIPENYTLPLPIGKSCGHVECKIFKDGLKDLEADLEGELFVSGPAVFSGYLNLPELSEGNFITCKEDKHWYKTGDIVKVDDSLNLVFQGRRDRMIKRNGYRIEAGEIENAISSFDEVLEASIISSEKDSTVSITACISFRNQQLTNLEIKQKLAQTLPLYMMPDNFVIFEHLPKTSTHKIDFEKLKEYIQ